jgi:glycerol-3-phosphate dehydrogenase
VEALTDGVFDLLILGGGITGAGVALDAVLRGWRVGLIDKGDFASGTSSVSSKLVHGGLRYLEHGGFHLVYEALRERGLLLENAPHLVRPLKFVLPFYEGTRLGPWKWRLGLTLYDLLAGRANIHRSRPVTSCELRQDFPTLLEKGLSGGATFFDAQMDDARLCLEVIRTATVHGACIANYVQATAFELQNGLIQGVRAVDHLSGQELRIRARVVLNATGPWGDAVCRLAGSTAPVLQPTKGVHIVVPHRGLAAAFLLLHPRDQRVLFVIPWMGKTLIGTTDTYTAEGPDHLHVLPEEVAYLLEAHNHYFRPALQPAEVLGSFVGLRPLLRSQLSDPSSLTREFRVFTSPSGLVSVAGGKYTTYRRMAEVITNTLGRRLGRPGRCRTERFPLDGTPAQVWTVFAEKETAYLARRHDVPVPAAHHLVHRYGRCAEDVARYLETDPDLARPLLPSEPDLLVELRYQRDHEMALFPEDHLLRRTRLGLWRPDLLMSVPKRVQEIIAWKHSPA